MALKFDNTIRSLKGLLFKHYCRGDLERYMALRSWVMHFVTSINLYERRALAALPRLIKPGDTVVDIGANFGGYTLRLSRLVGPNGTVLAFEPILGVFNQLRLRTFGTPNIRIFNLALSNAARDNLTLYIPLLEHAAPEPALASIEQLPEPCQKIPIKTETLDALTTQLKSLAFMKIDVEGHEAACLEGARETIERLRPVIQFEENVLTQRFDWYNQFARTHKLKLKFYSGTNFINLDRVSLAPTHERNFYFFPD